MKARFYFDVAFKASRKTDAEGMASALDNVIKTGMTALGESWDEYGGKPKIGEVFVLDTKQAMEHASSVNRVIAEYTNPDDLIKNGDDELGEALAPVVQFLRKLAGKK